MTKQTSLGQSAARGASVTVIGQIIRIACQLLGVVILSRLLGPSDFGLLAMLTAIIGLGEVLRDFGLANAAIQAPIVTRQQRTNLLWVNTALGLLIGIVVFCAAPFISSFYDEPTLLPVAQTLAWTFLLNGASAQYRASLTRSLRFVALFFVDVIPVVVGLAIAILFGVLRFGLWALVIQQLSVAALGLVLAGAICAWLPGLPRRVSGMGYFLRYGLHLSLAQVVAYVSRNADYVILGYRFGPHVTGFYSRAFDLVINPLNQINAPSSKVAVPVLSKLQDDSERFNRFVLTGQKMMLIVAVPILALGACLAYPLVELVLGPEWRPSAPIVQIMALAAISRVASYATYWIALSRGATQVSLYVNLVSAPILIASVAIGSVWGAVGVAWGFAIATFSSWFISLTWYSRAVGAPGLRMLMSALFVFSSSAIPAGLTLAVVWVLRDLDAWAQAGIGAALFLSTWAAQLILVPAYRRDIRAVFSAASLAWRRG